MIRRSSPTTAPNHVRPSDSIVVASPPLGMPEPVLPTDQSKVDCIGHVLRRAHRDALRDSRLGMMASVADAGLDKIARALTLARGLVMVLMKPDTLSADETTALHHTLDQTLAGIDDTAQQTTFERTPLLTGDTPDPTDAGVLHLVDARSAALGCITLDGQARSLADIRLTGALSPLTAPLKAIARIISAARNDIQHLQQTVHDVIDQLTARIHTTIHAAVDPPGSDPSRPTWANELVASVRSTLLAFHPCRAHLLRRSDAHAMLTLIT